VFWIVTAGGGDAASETWYDGEGNFFALITYRFAGTGGAGADDGTAGRIGSLEIKDRWAESCAWYGGGEMTRVESPAGVYTAVYGEKGPLYREYAPADAFSASGAASGAGPAAVLSASDAASGTGPAAAPVSGAPMDTPASAAAPFPSGTDFQWDERGFLVLLRNRDAGGAFAGEFRYEYGTDDRGNWTVRREIEMVRRSDMLVPVFRGALRRRIVYAEAGE
jgi:hypothetical protein